MLSLFASDLTRTPSFAQRRKAHERRPAWSAAAPGRSVTKVLFGIAMLDAALVFSGAVASGYAFQRTDNLDLIGLSGLVTGIVFVAVSFGRQDYDLARITNLRGGGRRLLAAWLMTFSLTLMLGFLTKTTAVFSRSVVLIFFFAGIAILLAARRAAYHVLQPRAAAGHLVTRSTMLIGHEDLLQGFMSKHGTPAHGMRIVGASVLRGPDHFLTEDLNLALASARLHRPDDIILLLPWSDTALISQCLDRLRCLPAAVHLGPAEVLEAFPEAEMVRTGEVTGLHLIRHPLSRTEILLKRAMDIVLSGLLLIVLAPLFAIVAIAIRLDNLGPVFFKQRRYGFNQEPFRIIKFRSMTTMEDHAALSQVTAGDARVTRMGRFMRRTNIDELPQLLNVLKGDMSLVGPRPHALAHDQQFKRSIALYARRHNVKPGMTGWAQVNGWRGETDTPEKIQGRIEHDLYYIDNWSAVLDLRILFRTAFSRKAFSNAR